MPSHLSNPWNNAVSFLSMFYGEHQLFNGSCFFWAREGRTYLLTNWHNLAGRHPHTDQPLHSMVAIPNRIEFWVYKRSTEPDSQGFFDLEYVSLKVQLCNSEFSEPQWFEHPIHGRKVDVAAIDITDLVPGFQIDHVNMLESDAVLDVAATQDVYIVGFPFGQIANAPAPIWKRGSIALDPTFDPEGLPKMLVDTATREGMSGSVVIARHIIAGRSHAKKDGTMSDPVLFGKRDLVVGIYSGRHYADLEKAQLGIVWKRRVIEETIAARRVATV